MTRLNDLRATLTEEQREILNTIWRYALEHNRAIPTIALCDTTFLEDSRIREALLPLGGNVVYATGEEEDYGMRRYHLTFLGHLLAERGEELASLLARYLDYVRNKLRSDPELERINITEAMNVSGFTLDQSSFFTHMFFGTPFHGGGSPTETGLPPRIHEWYSALDLQQYIEEFAVKSYNPKTPLDGGRQIHVQLVSSNSEGIRDQTPAELAESLERFRGDHPEPDKVSFVMMRFGKTPAHQEIISSIENVLGTAGMTALRADGKQYHDELLWNVLTYMHGCGSGIAVFERLEEETFNPNVSLEVGYMLALKKPVCFLKDTTLKTLHTDLIGRVYKEFDPQKAKVTISTALSAWLRDKGFLLDSRDAK